ncbi:MAG TPA: hypothetical protein VFG04_23005, partial [Planctomycetaceae bacterium]|nr:hypothetical protein [Planctomycetaceae bacterium]
MLLLHWLSHVRQRLALRRRYRRKRLERPQLAQTSSRMGPAAEALEGRVLLSANQPPTVVLPSPQTIGENTSLMFSSSNVITVGDIDANGGVEQVTLTVGQGVLTLGSIPTSTTVSGNSTNTVVLSDTIANLNTALDGLTYAPTTGFAGADSLSVSINDEGNTGDGGAQTTNASLGISVVPPTVTVTGGTTLAYTEGQSAAAIDAALSLSDASGTLSGATVAITGNFAAGEDLLAFSDTATISGSYNASTGVLTLSGNDTLATYQAALDSVAYRDTSVNPSTLLRGIGFSFTDGFATSTVATDDVSVTAVNTAPTITLPSGSHSIGENTSLTLASASAITVADVDANDGTEQ